MQQMICKMQKKTTEGWRKKDNQRELQKEVTQEVCFIKSVPGLEWVEEEKKIRKSFSKQQVTKQKKIK